MLITLRKPEVLVIGLSLALTQIVLLVGLRGQIDLCKINNPGRGLWPGFSLLIW